MNHRPIKATSKNVSLTPFYLIQTNGHDKRYVVWLRDKIRIRTLLAGFINQATTTINLRIVNFDRDEEGIVYSGTATKSELHQQMTKYEDVLFHNGYHDFMIRIPETGDNMVFDEHGLIFIYSQENYETALDNLGASYRPDEKLIYEFDHWHYCMPEGKEQLIYFIQALGLDKE